MRVMCIDAVGTPDEFPPLTEGEVYEPKEQKANGTGIPHFLIFEKDHILFQENFYYACKRFIPLSETTELVNEKELQA